jgi:predicted AlkP superfamily pyrophosphatase or phosphodiesterase
VASRRAYWKACLALLALAAVAASPLTPSARALTAAAATPISAAPPRGYVTDHLIVISIDGLRPDAIERYGARTLLRLMREGSYSLAATTIVPSRTLPSHTSMLTGADLEQHGVTWNREEMEIHGHVATPTIFAAAKQAGFHTAAFFSKSKFQHLAVPGTLDHVDVPHEWPYKRSADRTIDIAEQYLEANRPNLLFVHLGEPDFVGHLIGWMSVPYSWAVREADDELADLLETADRVFGAGNYTVLVTADHGGHGRDHGSADPRDVTIPWIAWGKGVAPGKVLSPGIRTMDTAATSLWLLGVELPKGSSGKPVQQAFVVQPAN